MTKYLIYIFFLIFLFSCNVKNVEEAEVIATSFISENEIDLNELRNDLNKLVINESLVYFSASKPGSHILYSSCPKCIENLSFDISAKIADKMDQIDLAYVNVKKDAYVEYGLRIRNTKLNNYEIREYIDLNDTTKYSSDSFNQYLLKDKWILCSDTKGK